MRVDRHLDRADRIKFILTLTIGDTHGFRETNKP